MAIFGKILYLPFSSGTIVFIDVLVVFTIFEGLLHILEVECNKRGLKGLVKKMYREFMIMGFISFAILLATELSTFKADIWYDAFHFAHIVLLFIGFVFLIQSGLLISLVNSRKKTLLEHDSSSSEELIIDYVNLQTSSNYIMKYIFNYGPISIPIPELREKIEYKIIQEFFIRNYNLPQEFKFANYICRVLKDYLISLVEVRPISWIVLACFVALNLLRIEYLDKIYAYDVCEQYPAKNLHRNSGSAHRLLSMLYNTTSNIYSSSTTTTNSNNSSDFNTYYNSNGSSIVEPYAEDDHHDDHYIEPYAYHVCQEYLLRYTLMCLFFIVLYVIGVLIASEIYIQRLIDKVLDQEETIEWLEEEEQRLQFLNQEESNLIDSGLVDIHALPDDTKPVEVIRPATTTSGICMEPSNNSGEMKRDSMSTDGGGAGGGGGSGMEYTDIYNTTGSTAKQASHTNTTTTPPNHPTTGTSSMAIRRLASNYRMASLRARNNSVDDFLETGVLPPPPVHGTTALRRLTMNHRIASTKGNDLAALIAAGNTIGTTSNTHNTGPPVVPNHPGSDAIAHAQTVLQQRRRVDSLRSTGSVRSDIDTTTNTAGTTTGGTHPTTLHRSRSQQQQPQLSLDIDTSVAGIQNARRLALYHRTGSLRSDTGDGDHSTGNVSGNLPHHTINSPVVPSKRRLMSSYRTGSLRSDISERSKGSSGNGYGGGGKHDKTDLVNTSKNRRFLYLRCLERIMHVEFDFHANEAKQMMNNTEEYATTGTHGVGNSSKERATNPREVFHSPSHIEKHDHHHPTIYRTQSLSSMYEAEAHVHTDMRSNFALMKSLRQEMLQEQEYLAHAEVDHTYHASKGFFGTGGFFSSMSPHSHGHNTTSVHGHNEILPAYVPAPTASGALKHCQSEPVMSAGFRPILRRNSKEEGDLETGGSLYATNHTTTNHTTTIPTTTIHNTDIYERSSNHSTEGIELSTIKQQPLSYNHNKTHTMNNTTDHKTQRKRALSLAFEPQDSKNPGGFLTKPIPPQPNKFMQFLYNISHIIYIIYIRIYNTLLGHHIGEVHEYSNIDIQEMEKDFSKIFLFSSSELYYFMVEFCLLAQCVYLALWATNFVFIALDSYHPILWNIALILPIPLNFLLTKQIIFTSAILKSIVTLDKSIADKICENAMDERNIKHRIRKMIRSSLKNLNIHKSEWVQYLDDQMDLYIPENSINHSINIQEFTLFLHSLSIFLTDTTVARIFKVIDVNKDQYIDFDNLFPIIFPELMKKQVKIKRTKSNNQTTTTANGSGSMVNKNEDDNNIDSYRIQGDLSNTKIKKKEKNELRKMRRASSIQNKDSVGSVATDTDLTEQTYGLISPCPSPLPYNSGYRSNSVTSTNSYTMGTSGSIKHTRFAEDLTSTNDHATTSSTKGRQQQQVDEEEEDDFRSDDSEHGGSSSDSDSSSDEDPLFEEYEGTHATNTSSKNNHNSISNTSGSSKQNTPTQDDQQSIYAPKRPSTTMFDV